MYESFYGLKEKPFSMLPDPGFLYLSKKHQKALTLFEYGLMNHAGFCVISGEIGSGKTTILRKLLENMNRNIAVGMITNTHKGFGNLLDWVLSAFDIHEKGLNDVEKHQRFMDFLVEQYARKKTTLLIVDEAQNMAADKLEELRMLSNINADKDQVIQIILAGQPELKDTLSMPELKQFVQRIAVDYHLGSLDQEDTRGYIAHRLAVAGSEKKIFTDDACDLIYKYSGGTPRLINLLCDTALVYGFADQQEMIDEDLVAEMILERMQSSLVPLACTEPPKKKLSNSIKKEDSAESNSGTQSTTSDEVEINEHDFGEKVLQANATEHEVEADQPEKTELNAIIKTEDETKDDTLDSVNEDIAYQTEERQAATEFPLPKTPPRSLLLKPLLIGLSVLVLATLLFALSLEDDAATSVSETYVDNDKSEPEPIIRQVVPLEQSEIQPVEQLASDVIKQQLDDAQKIQQEMLIRQQESEARMKALEEQAVMMQRERDQALAKAKAEKEKRAAEARAARIAAEREKEASAMAQKAIAEAMAAERKARLLEELRLKEKQAKEHQAREKQAKEQQEAAAAAAAKELAEAEKKQQLDIRCEGATARFLSTCR